MKTQLLQDIDESRIDFVPRSADKKPAAAYSARGALATPTAPTPPTSPVAPRPIPRAASEVPISLSDPVEPWFAASSPALAVPVEAESSAVARPEAAVAMSFAPQPPFAALPPHSPRPPQPPRPTQPTGAGPATARSSVWSFKERLDAADGETDAASAHAAPKSPPVHAPAAPVESDVRMFDARDDEPPLVMPKAIEWPSRQAPPVLEPLVIEKDADWFDRWGRYAAWAVCLLLVVMFAAGGLWMYRESKIDGTMALLATKTAPLPPAATAVPAAPPPAAVSLGSDALRQPDTVAPATAIAPEAAAAPAPAAAPEVAPDVAPDMAPDVAPEAAPAPASSVPGRAAPAAKAAKADTPSEKLVLLPAEPAAAEKQPNASVSREVAQVTTQPALAARAPVKARAPASPKRTPAPAVKAETAPAPASRGNDMAETLRQCRAMGYHSTQCIERGCYTTKYGLVCKG